jgi:predicted transposase YdaD
MPIYLEDLKESILFKEGEQLGQQRGEQIGQQRGEQIGQQRAAAQHREQLIDLLATALKSRFDRVPATYTKRMQTATSDQLCRWIANVATAIDLPSVFRK